MIREKDRKIFRQKLNNAIPSLLNTLDELQTKKILEKDKESDDNDVDKE